MKRSTSDNLFDPAPNTQTASPSIIEKLDQLAQTANQDLGSDAVMMSVYHNNALHSLGVFPSPGGDLQDRQHAAEDTVCIRTIGKNAPLLTEDARQVSALQDIKYVRDGMVTGYLGIPITNSSLGAIGSVCSISRTPRKWTPLEQNYLQQVANSVELILLQEMTRLELASYTDSFSELDKIVAALSSNTAMPTSIYEANGRLAFANAALLSRVSEYTVSSFWANRSRQMLAATGATDAVSDGPIVGDSHVTVETKSGQKTPFRISSSVSASGLIVCSWFGGLTEVR